ncbi:MAG: hypothetical protein RLZZ536_2700 [Planctomycetota bacterium]|jgi:RNA polymerase sigma factor (sigma-70 family)
MSGHDNEGLESGNRFISRIETEPGIENALQRSVSPPADDDDELTQQRKKIAIAQQQSERERFLKRYQLAILGYLGAFLRDQDAVDAVWDKFVDKWLDGKLGTYDPNRSFRRFLKEVLRNDVYAYWNTKRREQQRGNFRLDSAFEHEDDLDRTASEVFDCNLRDEILEQALESMDPGSPGHQLISLLTEAAISGNPLPDTEELARIFGISPDAARQRLHRSRKLYADKIIEQVVQLIHSRNLEHVRETLIDLDLLKYCKKALEQLEAE